MGRHAAESPALTVAIPTCNGARYLRPTLESILAQASVDFEVLLVDDRSDDPTLAIAREVVGDRARIEIKSERLGLAGNWNRCVDLSRTSLVAIFHQDDLMLAGHLATHLAAFRRAPTLGWAASGASVVDRTGRPVSDAVVEPGGLGSGDRDFEAGRGVAVLATHNPIRCSAVTISRSAHREVGGFDPAYRYVVDWDYWLRVAAVRPVAWRAGRTVAVRWHPASETHRFAGGTTDLDETTRLLDRIASVVDAGCRLDPGWRRTADRRLARAFLNRAYVASKHRDGRLARRALARSIQLAPATMIRALAFDPRPLARLGLACLASANTGR